MSRKKKKKASNSINPRARDRHLLYSAAVQSPEADLDFFERVYRKKRGARLRLLREDFCGTAAMSCEWVKRSKKNRAIGVDLDLETLEWGKKNYFPMLGDAVERIDLRCANVLDDAQTKVEAVNALNFSYSVFKTRDELRAYFGRVRESLLPGGLFFVDAFGGTEALQEDREERTIDASRAFDGTKIPRFTYIWDQKSFNPVDHHMQCRIHFQLKDGTRLKRAFVYDWRLWTLPEIHELMLEAGFAATEVYIEGWDNEADDTDGIFRRRKKFENQSGWVAYVVGLT
ncbi:MAG: class I SAM-dependent methyltransferase [bacterium]|nr:class I SAM-dependent methyltransferase [bacterium]